MEPDLKTMLSDNADDHFFNTFIPEKILQLSVSQIQTVQFVFWFCYSVEKELNEISHLAWKTQEEIEGKTPKDVIEFIENKLKIKVEKIDSTHSEYDIRGIMFNDLIDIFEKISGISDFTRFLRKIKGLRNDLSHLRIGELSYEGEDLLDNKVKSKLLGDYIQLMVDFNDMKSEGGLMNQLSEEDKQRIDAKYYRWKENVE